MVDSCDKAMDRKLGGFAVLCLAVVRMPGESAWRIVLERVASTPGQLTAVASRLASLGPEAREPTTVDEISRSAVTDTAPLSNNR